MYPATSHGAPKFTQELSSVGAFHSSCTLTLAAVTAASTMSGVCTIRRAKMASIHTSTLLAQAPPAIVLSSKKTLTYAVSGPAALAAPVEAAVQPVTLAVTPMLLPPPTGAFVT